MRATGRMKWAMARRTGFPAGATTSSSTTPTRSRTRRPNGSGNLAITARRADGSLSCYYGPCEITSARLVSQHKAEFAYGRIEARVKVPAGAGLWPAFWSLGSNIADVGWPQTRRDRHHGIRGPRTQRSLRHDPRPRLFRRRFLRRHAAISACRCRMPSTRSRSSGSRTASTGSSTGSSTTAPRPRASRPTSGCSTTRSS